MFTGVATLLLTLTTAAFAQPPLTGHVEAPPSLNERPLYFEANRGQAHSTVRYVGRGRGLTVLAEREAVAFWLTSPTHPSRESAALRMRFAGATAPVQVQAETALAGRVHYLLGRDRRRWVRDVPTFGSLRYEDLYPGIDLVLRGVGGGRLEYDFHVSPGAELAQIAVVMDGATSLTLDETGGLRVVTPDGELYHRPPVMIQRLADGPQTVEGRFVLRPDGRVGFAATYDRTLALVVDPLVEVSTYVGGDSADGASAVALDATGLYVAGTTASMGRGTGGAYQPDKSSGLDAYVAKWSPDGTTLVYWTYLGDAQQDSANGLVVDTLGRAVVGGKTLSPNFPVENAIQSVHGGGSDAFLSLLSADGSTLVYSTLLGGSGDEVGLSVAVSPQFRLFLGGRTTSADLPVVNAIQSTYGGAQDGFLARYAATTTNAHWVTYVGGSGLDTVADISLSGHLFATGTTLSNDFPGVAATSLQPALGGGSDAFVVRVLATGGTLVFSNA